MKEVRRNGDDVEMLVISSRVNPISQIENPHCDIYVGSGIQCISSRVIAGREIWKPLLRHLYIRVTIKS